MRSPSKILAAPPASRLQPHGKRLRKVFSRMGLCVPCIQIQNIVPAPRLGLIPLGIGYAVAAKSVGPGTSGMEPERVIDRVSGLVTQNPHAFAFACSLHFQHLRTFELD